MKCPICGKDVELQKKQVGVDELGEPIFNQYAICRDCRKQWNLDKQRAKKAASNAKPVSKEPAKVSAVENGQAVKPEGKKAAGKPAAKPVAKKSAAADGSGRPAEKPAVKPTAKKSAAADGSGRPAEKTAAKPTAKKSTAADGSGKPAAKPAAKKSAAADGSGRPMEKPAVKPAAKKSAAADGSGRPAEKPAAKPAAKKSVAADGSGKPAAKPAAKRKASADDGTRPAGKKTRPAAAAGKSHSSDERGDKTAAGKKDASQKVTSITEEQRYGNIPSEKVREKKERAVKKGYEDMLSTDPNYTKNKKKKPVSEKKKSEPEVEEEYDDIEDISPRFRGIRVVLGILSILAFAYFAYMGFLAGLDNIASGGNVSTGTTYIVLALCMLVAGLLLLIMQKRSTIFAFILPMIFYLGSAVYAFLKRSGDSMLLYGAIAGAVLAVIFLILAIASRGQDEEGYDDYEDPFEDDFE